MLNLEPATGITTSPYSDSPSLPTFMPSAEAQFSWGDRSAAEFTKLLDDTYREVTQWQKPLSCSCWELRQGFCIWISKIFLCLRWWFISRENCIEGRSCCMCYPLTETLSEVKVKRQQDVSLLSFGSLERWEAWGVATRRSFDTTDCILLNAFPLKKPIWPACFLIICFKGIRKLLFISSLRTVCHWTSGPGEFGPGGLNLLVSHVGEFCPRTTFPGEYGPWSVNTVRVTFPRLVRTTLPFYCWGWWIGAHLTLKSAG